MNAFEAFDLSVGKEFACAAFHDGSVRCWGHNNYGQLGVGSTVSKNDPTLVSGYALGSDEFTFFSGMDHALPFHAAGWGFEAEVVSVLPPHFEWDNTSMTLNIGEHAQPGNITVDVAFSIPSGTISVQAGIELLEIIDPWSDRINAHTLGFGIIDDVDSNIPVEIESGDQATCVMYRGTKTQCIGNSQYGVLGSGSTSSLSSMANINAFSEPLRSISMNDNHACGIDVEFQLWCWGLNSYGQLGMGDTTQRTTPGGLSTDASGQPLGFAFVVETGFGGHTCGIIDRTTHCWGENDQGQLGDDSTTNRNRPVPVVSTDGTEFTDLALGYKHACGVAVNGSVYCWGYNNDGQLGDNSTTSSNVPVHVDVPSSAPVVAIDAGYRHTCALTGMNQVYCWGYNSQGSLGDGTTLNAHSPSQVQFPSLNGQHIVQLSSGEHFNCALLDNGTALCWGSNDYNQVEGDLSDHLSGVVTTPTFLNITESGYLSSLDLGKHHACAVLVNSDVKCWGATFAHVPRAAQRISTALNLINQTSASKLLYPQGWGVVTANLTSVPAAFDYTFPRLDVSLRQPASTPFRGPLPQSKGRSKGRFQFSGQCLIFTPVNRTNGTTALSTSLLNPLSRWSTFKQETVMLVESIPRGQCTVGGPTATGNSVMALNLERSLRHLFDSQTHRPPFSRRELVTTTPVRSRPKEGCFAGVTTTKANLESGAQRLHFHSHRRKFVPRGPRLPLTSPSPMTLPVC